MSASSRKGLLAGLALLVSVLLLGLPPTAAAAPVPLAQVGSSGSGAGGLIVPRGVAIDAAGRLYVSEASIARINVYDPSGSFIHAFGFGVDTGASAFETCTTASGCQAGLGGDGAGQLDSPSGVALDGSGYLYVVDNDQNRVNVFDVSGTPAFVRAFGVGVDTGASAFEVCTAASGCQAGPFGGAAGGLNAARGAVLDGAGHLYVGDEANRRVSVFDVGGTPSFVHAFGFGVDTGASAFEFCTTSSGCQSGLAGGGAGQLNQPFGLALDGSGTAYVADRVNNRVSVFGVGGTPSFLRAFGFGVDTGAPLFEVCTGVSGCQPAVGAGAGAGQLSDPSGTAIDCRGAVWVADTNNRRLQRFGEPGTAPLPCLPPNTSIEKAPKAKSRDRTPTWRFASPSAGATFECSLDAKPFQACISPFTRRVKVGKHRFQVRAKTVDGTDATPATDSFKVSKGKRRKRK